MILEPVIISEYIIFPRLYRVVLLGGLDINLRDVGFYKPLLGDPGSYCVHTSLLAHKLQSTTVN